MKKILTLCFLIASNFSFSQSKTIDALDKKYSDALSLFFYNNTLRMLNQSDSREFDELIKDIEKMKFLMIDKEKMKFGAPEYKKLVSDYKAESFEAIMTSRAQGKSFDVYLKEKDGKTKGMVVIVNDSSSLYVLDILGRVALDKVGSLYNTLGESTDVGAKIKSFADRNKKDKEDEEDDND